MFNNCQMAVTNRGDQCSTANALEHIYEANTDKKVHGII